MGVSPSLQLNLLLLFRGYHLVASFLSLKGFIQMTDKITTYEQALEQLPRIMEDFKAHPENFKLLERDIFNPLTVLNGGKQND